MDIETWKQLGEILFSDGPPTPQELVRRFREIAETHESQQPEKPRRYYDYGKGPFLFLAQQVERAMHDAGYPCKIAEFYRTPERQAELLEKRPPVTKAGPYGSAHQYYMAADLIHPTKGWNVTEDYWDTLAACVRAVAEKFDVEIEHGHYWRFRDSAHIQLGDWRDFKRRVDAKHPVGPKKPGDDDLRDLWHVVLPEVARNKGL